MDAGPSRAGICTGHRYGLKTLWAALRLVLHRSGIWGSRKFMP